MRLIRAFRRLGVARRIVVLAVLAAGLSVLAVGAGVAGAALYATYGYHPAENARSWAALTPRYGDPSQCASCHATEYARWSQAKHNAVTCESCHGPLAAHAADPGDAGAITLPTTDACITCHEQVTGRPAAQPQVDVAVHYTGVTCLQCHNAHTSLAESPKQITHPLANLPTCITCHGPDQLRQFPAGHSVADDSVCLGCHRPAQSGR
jgi:predicted CXXCH cytochrome family protein